MTDDTISRAEVIDWYCKWECDSKYCGIPCQEVEELQGFSSAERRGKWELIRMDEDTAGNGFYRCSCCGKGDIHAPEVKVSYCWNCGAKMEGADDSTDDAVADLPIEAYIDKDWRAEPSQVARDIATIIENEMDMRVIERTTNRIKGEWVDTGTSYADVPRQYCRCSICGRLSPRPLGDFCRWCGAKMEGADDER